MKVAIYGKRISETFSDSILEVFKILDRQQCETHIFENYYRELKEAGLVSREYPTYNREKHNIAGMDCMVSIGGDGTLLDTVSFIKDSNVPLLGLNAGRLGFISSIALNEFQGIIVNLKAGEHHYEERSLIKLDSERKLFGDDNVGLNEVSIHNKETASMITIKTYIGDEFLNNYWADGLIISTATGSTAYSLSCGGPIITPGSRNFVITPIAPHNLNMRPFVISNETSVRLSVSGRSNNFHVALDGRTELIMADEEIVLSKAPYSIRLLKPQGGSFFNTLRNKLAWGLDKRN